MKKTGRLLAKTERTKKRQTAFVTKETEGRFEPLRQIEIRERFLVKLTRSQTVTLTSAGRNSRIFETKADKNNRLFRQGFEIQTLDVLSKFRL